MKKVLITGANSYIGNAVEVQLKSAGWMVDVLDMCDDKWRHHSFSCYDCVFHVAGIAHDSKKKKDRELYYKVNFELTIEVAEHAKISGVRQFIFMSTMLIYNGVRSGFISKDTAPLAKGCYADSKLRADRYLATMNCQEFNVAILRPPMIFGKGCKGNMPRLLRLADKLFFFPKVANRRSMLHIKNLCSFVFLLIENQDSGIFFPQNEDFFCTSEIIAFYAKQKQKRIWFTRLFNPLIWIGFPFLSSMRKLFGNFMYEKKLSFYENGEYLLLNNEESLLDMIACGD